MEMEIVHAPSLAAWTASPVVHYADTFQHIVSSSVMRVTGGKTDDVLQLIGSKSKPPLRQPIASQNKCHLGPPLKVTAAIAARCGETVRTSLSLSLLPPPHLTLHPLLTASNMVHLVKANSFSGWRVQ